MEVKVFGLIPFAGPAEVTALSLHPRKALVIIATSGPSGFELVEADAGSGDVFKRTNVGRRVRFLKHVESRDGSYFVMAAFERGDIEVWDTETMAVKDRILAAKKEDGKPVLAWTTATDNGSIQLYISRGGSSLERLVLMEKRGKAQRNDYKNWKPITVIAAQPNTSTFAVGLADGEVKFVDCKTLQQSSQMLSPSSVDPRYAPNLKSAVTSISFHPRENYVAVCHAQGSIALWRTRKDTFEGLLLHQAASRQLVEAQFHPWLPSLLSLSDDGTLHTWSIVAGPKGLVMVDAPEQTSTLPGIERAYYGRTFPCARCWPMSGATRLHLHRTLNILTVTPRRAAAHIHASNPASSSLPLLELRHPVSPNPLLLHSSALVLPSALALERPAPHVILSSAHFFFLHGHRLKAFSLALSRSSDLGVVPPTDAAGRPLRPLLLSAASAWGLVAVGVQSSGGERSVVVLPAGRPDDGEDGGREMFFHGIGSLGEGGSVDGKSARGGEVSDDAPLAVVPARDACFVSGGWLALLAADGRSVAMHELPPLQAGGAPPDVREWAGRLRRGEASGETVTIKDAELQRIYAPNSERGGAEVRDRVLGVSPTTREVLLIKKGWDGQRNRAAGWGVGSVPLAVGELVVTATWQVGGRECAVATTDRLLMLSVPEGQRDELRVRVLLQHRGLSSCMWFGRGVVVTDRTHVLSVTASGSVQTMAALGSVGGLLCAVLPDRVVLLTQEGGRPAVVSRAVSMLDCLVRSCLEQDAVDEAEGVVDKYDKSRVATETLTAMCAAGMGASAMQVVKDWAGWLPWRRQWEVAAAACEHRQCLIMLDRKVADKDVDPAEASELYLQLGHKCGALGLLRTAAACLVRAGRCGCRAGYWTLLDLLDATGSEEGWRDLMAVATEDGEEYLAVACGMRLQLSADDLAKRVGGPGQHGLDAAPWVDGVQPRGRRVQLSDDGDEDSRGFGLTDAEQTPTGRRVVGSKPFGKVAPRAMARVQTRDGEAELDGVDLAQLSAWAGVRFGDGIDVSSHGVGKLSRPHSLASSEDGSTVVSGNQARPAHNGAPASEGSEGRGGGGSPMARSPLPATGKRLQEVDEEGYVIRPEERGATVDDGWGEGGGSDGEEQQRSQIKVEIKDRSEATAATSAELHAAVQGISLDSLGLPPPESKTRSRRRGGGRSSTQGSQSTPLAPMDSHLSGSSSTPLPPMDAAAAFGQTWTYAAPFEVPPFPKTSSLPGSPSTRLEPAHEEPATALPESTLRPVPSAGEHDLWQAFGDDDEFGAAFGGSGGFGDDHGGFGSVVGFGAQESGAGGFGDNGGGVADAGAGFGEAVSGFVEASGGFGGQGDAFAVANTEALKLRGDDGFMLENGGGFSVENGGGFSVENGGGFSVENGGGFSVENGGGFSVENGGGFDSGGFAGMAAVAGSGDDGAGAGFGEEHKSGGGGGWIGFGGGPASEEGGEGGSSIGVLSPLPGDVGSVGGGMSGVEGDGDGYGQEGGEGESREKMTPSPTLDEDSSSMEDGQEGGGGIVGFTPPEASAVGNGVDKAEGGGGTKFTRHVRGLSDPKALEGVAEIVMSVENQHRHAFSISPVEMEERFLEQSAAARVSPLELLKPGHHSAPSRPAAPEEEEEEEEEGHSQRAGASKFQLFDDDSNTVDPAPISPIAPVSPARDSEPPKRPPPPPPPKTASPGKVMFPVLRKGTQAASSEGSDEAAHGTTRGEARGDEGEQAGGTNTAEAAGTGEGQGRATAKAEVSPSWAALGKGEQDGAADEAPGWVSFAEGFGGSEEEEDDFA